MVTSNSTDAPTRVHARLVRSLTQPQPAGRDGRATDGGLAQCAGGLPSAQASCWPPWRRSLLVLVPSGGPLHALVTSSSASSSSRARAVGQASGRAGRRWRRPSAPSGTEVPTAAGLGTALQPALATAPLAGHTSWSVVDVVTGQVLVTQGELASEPASTLKLLTAAAALTVLSRRPG